AALAPPSRRPRAALAPRRTRRARRTPRTPHAPHAPAPPPHFAIPTPNVRTRREVHRAPRSLTSPRDGGRPPPVPPQFLCTSTGASNRITMREPTGRTASTSAVPMAIAVPAAAPTAAPLRVDSVFLPSTWPRIAPAAAPPATFAADWAVVVRVRRSGFASTTEAWSG